MFRTRARYRELFFELYHVVCNKVSQKYIALSFSFIISDSFQPTRVFVLRADQRSRVQHNLLLYGVLFGLFETRQIRINEESEILTQMLNYIFSDKLFLITSPNFIYLDFQMQILQRHRGRRKNVRRKPSTFFPRAQKLIKYTSSGKRVICQLG